MAHYYSAKMVQDLACFPIDSALETYISQNNLTSPFVGTERDLAEWAKAKGYDLSAVFQHFRDAQATNYKLGATFVQIRHALIGSQVVVVYGELPTVAKQIPPPFTRQLELFLQ